MSFSSHLNKSKLAKITQLEEKIALLEHKQHQHFSDTIARMLKLIKTELCILLRYRAKFMMHRTRHNYCNGSRPTHLLALKLHNDEKYTDIESIRSSKDEILTGPLQINHEFASFYKNLYSSHISFNKNKCKQFLESISLTHLSRNDVVDLSEQLTLVEIENALKDMKKGKSPGWDGIPPEFYLKGSC